MSIKNFITKNWIGLAGLIVGILGTLLAVYYYQASKQYAEPALILNPNKTFIVAKEDIENTPIRVTRKDGSPVNESVTSATLYFWNNGTKAIHEDEILAPINIYFQDESIEILEYKLLNVSRKVIKADLSKVPNENKLNLNFFILEPNDGFSFQVIYAGNPSAVIDHSGIIEGTQIKTTTEFTDELFWSKLFENTINFGKVLFIIVSFGFIVTMTIEISEKLAAKYPRLKTIFNIIPILLLSTAALAILSLMIITPISDSQKSAHRDIYEVVPESITSQIKQSQ